MKSTNTIFQIVLSVAVVVLFILHFTTRKGDLDSSQKVTSCDTLSRLPLAYINVDSLLSKYAFSRNLNEQMLRQTESAQATLNQQGRALEAEMAEFKRKVDNNAFFDPERAKKEQERILKKQQSFQELNQRLTLELQQKQDETNRMLRDTIMSQMQAFNALHKYHMIFSNAMNDNILFANDTYDITNEFVEFLNKRYIPSTQTEKE